MQQRASCPLYIIRRQWNTIRAYLCIFHTKKGKHLYMSDLTSWLNTSTGNTSCKNNHRVINGWSSLQSLKSTSILRAITQSSTFVPHRDMPDDTFVAFPFTPRDSECLSATSGLILDHLWLVYNRYWGWMNRKLRPPWWFLICRFVESDLCDY